MDSNKADKLREIGYTIPKTCLLCEHAQLSNNLWGTCKKETYFHLKHKKQLPLSISASGSCSQWKKNESIDLHGFNEFLKT